MVILEKRSQQQDAARKGRAAECLVAAWLLLRHNVWVSIMPDAASVDMLVQRQGDPVRSAVQVKMVYRGGQSGKPLVNLCKSDGSPYTANEIDYVIAVDTEAAVFWVFPIALASQYTRLQLNGRYSGYAYDWQDAHPKFAG